MGEPYTKSHLELVAEFHKALGEGRIADKPTLGTARLRKLRYSLIREEVRELKEALEKRDIIAVADALADIDYVVQGAALEFGIDQGRTFREVHRSNMTKVVNGKVLYREDGKVLKGEQYEPPDLSFVKEGMDE